MPHFSRLNVAQADAVRLEWDETQQPTQGETEDPIGSDEEQEVPETAKASTRKRATPSPTPVVAESSEDEEMSVKETQKQRNTRKGKAPVRPVQKAARPARRAVKSVNRLVSDNESIATEGSDYVVSPGLSSRYPGTRYLSQFGYGTERL